MGSAKTKPGCQSPTDGGGRGGGGHVYTAVYDKQPYTCVYYMRRIWYTLFGGQNKRLIYKNNRQCHVSCLFKRTPAEDRVEV